MSKSTLQKKTLRAAQNSFVGDWLGNPGLGEVFYLRPCLQSDSTILAYQYYAMSKKNDKL